MNNKTLISIVIAAAVVVVLIVLGTRSNDSELAGTPTTSPAASVSASPSGSPIRTGAQTPAKTLTYQEALNKYGTNRFQFNEICQASPTRMVIKKGSFVMLDNRANVARTITVGTTKYSLLKYGFRVYQANTIGTFLIDCGSQQNIATLIVGR